MVIPGVGINVVLAVLAGLTAGGGVLLLFVAIRGLPESTRPSGSASRGKHIVETLSRKVSIAVIAFVAVLVVTRWVVMAAAAAALVIAWDSLIGSGGDSKGAMGRVEALASWTESLRDTIAGAVGLEQAIPASVRGAAPQLQPHLLTMIDRLRTRMPLPAALHRFADDLDDPSADLIVAALILNAKLRGPGLRDLLGALSTSAREELDMRRRVDAGRRSTRRSVQIVVFVTVFVALALVVFNRSYVAAYNSAIGQVVLLVVLALFAAAFAWLKRLSRFEVPARFLGGSPDLFGAADPVSRRQTAAPRVMSGTP